MQTKEERAAYTKKYRESCREEIAAYAKKYNEDNKEEIASKRKMRYADKREEILAVNRLYKEAHKEELLTYNRDRRSSRNLMLFEYKGSECAHCKLSEPDHLEIYDYHHVDPTTKLHGITNINHGSLERLMTEVDKCLLLCGNCHRKEHARLHKEKISEHS